MNPLEQFRDAMRKAGLDYAGPISADGRLHRFRAGAEKAPNSWYVMFPGPPAGGAFGCWRLGIKEAWCDRQPKSYSASEWKSLRAAWAAAEAQRKQAESKRHAEARVEATRIFGESCPATRGHPYLQKKRVDNCPVGLLEQDGKLVLPLRDAGGTLHSLQLIAADGEKRFLPGGRVQGCFFTVSDKSDGPLVVCEGLATGMSIHAATGYAVVCAMNCGNLLAVAKALRTKFPTREIVVAADDDHTTVGNPGLTKANEAAKAVGAWLVGPRFTEPAGKSDFNDLHTSEGLDVVRLQINASMNTQTEEMTPEEIGTTCKPIASDLGGNGEDTETPEQVFERLAALAPVAYDRCRATEAGRLKIRTSTLDTEVAKRRPREPAELPQLERWPDPVDGAELLEDIASTFRRFCHLPAHADVVLAVWTLFTYCYRKFDFAAIIAVWSPEPECGKGRVLDVEEQLAMNAFRTANTSPAVLYHTVGHGDLTVLIDEFDSQHPEQREAIGNILKSGFQTNGRAHRMTERNGEQVVVEFSTFAPKMIATIGLDTLDKASRTRSIGVRMSRKPREVKLAKFRRYDGTDIRRRCVRWAQDNADAMNSIGALELDECATDRQEDVWEPLVVIARLAGGKWEPRIREAAQVLSGGATAAATESAGHQVLEAIREHLKGTGLTRITTKDLWGTWPSTWTCPPPAVDAAYPLRCWLACSDLTASRAATSKQTAKLPRATMRTISPRLSRSI